VTTRLGPKELLNPTAKTVMKIIVWGINYAPELTGIAPCNTALCSYLQKQGHDIRMVTTFAYYPAWNKAASDHWRLFRTEVVGDVRVHRCWHYVPARPRALTRMIHEASFVFTSFARLLALPRPDVFVVISPPLLLGLAAWLLTRFKRAPFVFHVQDLQPDAAVGLGMVHSGLLTRALYWIEAIAYRKAARVSGISQGMIEAFRRKGVPSRKTAYLPNGVALPKEHEFPAPGRFRERYGLGPSDVVAVYSGNLGVKQGLEHLIDIGRRLQNPGIHVVICGGGARRDLLAERIRRCSLRNVRLLPLQPEQHYREMLVDADIAIITQQRGAGSFCFPSKLLGNLAYGKPILAIADGTSELTHAVINGGFGISVPAHDSGAAADALEMMAENPLLLSRLGKAGRRYAEQFEMRQVLARFADQLCHASRGTDS
jgi:colanic acid biosynthesis glycosyl transferase WcaI